MTTAFVAGATGYTGREVVRQLAAGGVRAIAHIRPDSPSLAEWRERVERMGAVVDATLWQQDALDASLSQHSPDWVFALLGTTKARARVAQKAGAIADYETVDYGMTRMLLDAVSRGSPHARFVYLSSMGARSDTRNAYLNARGRIEETLMTSGLSWTIARPAIISGIDRDESRALERIAAVAGDGALDMLARVGLPSLRERFRSIDSESLARALILAAHDANDANRILDAAALHRRSA